MVAGQLSGPAAAAGAAAVPLRAFLRGGAPSARASHPVVPGMVRARQRLRGVDW